MICFHNDYSEGCHEKILQRLMQTNMEQTPGYGEDAYCASAAQKIRRYCEDPSLDVHFLVGGTQTNLTVIAAALRPYQGVIAAVSGHIHVHETGAVEAAGHKVLAVASADGKILPQQVERTVLEQRDSGCAEHMVQPKMVYISHPTELGTLYTKQELEELRDVCDRYGLYLFLDGARLGYGLQARGNDVFLPDLARLCDVFYIGGTKVGALFGEAVVIKNPLIGVDFRYMIKQRGGMLAKGRLLGIQFDVLFEDGLYFEISAHANMLADQIREKLHTLGVPLLVESTTNQIFPILPDDVLDGLSAEFTFTEQERVDDHHRAVRFCTSWATTKRNTDALCDALEHYLG